MFVKISLIYSMNNLSVSQATKGLIVNISRRNVNISGIKDLKVINVIVYYDC